MNYTGLIGKITERTIFHALNGNQHLAWLFSSELKMIAKDGDFN